MDIKDNINNLDFEIEPDITVQNETVIIQSDSTNLQEPVTDVRTKTPRKYRTTSFQARLGKELDNIARKVLDDRIGLTAHPTDMLRISVKRDSRSGDLLSRTITSSEVVPIIFPKMTDVPLRQFATRDDKEVLLPSFYAFSQEQHFDLYAPIAVQLDVDDLLKEDLHADPPISIQLDGCSPFPDCILHSFKICRKNNVLACAVFHMPVENNIESLCHIQSTAE